MARSRRRADIGGYDLSPENAAGDDFDESDDGGLISSAPAVELVDLYGNAGNNQPLDQLFTGIDGEAASEAVDAMNAALATGANPLTVVTDLAAILDVSRARAETIARTEMLGAWRDAQSINFRANSDVLDGWVWSSSLGGACIACVMMDGTVHPLDEDMDSHPNCACVMAPLTKSWDDILGDIDGFDMDLLHALGPETDYLNEGYIAGEDWFLRQPESYQLETLGPAKFEAWQSGEVDLLDFVGQKDSGAWGNEIYERSLKEIGLDANAYLGRTTLADVTAGAAEEATATEAATEGAEVSAVDAYGEDQSAAVDKAIDRVLGNDVSQQDVAALIGAPDDATVHLGTFKSDMGGGMTDVIAVSMKGPEVADSDVVSFDAAGNGHYVAYRAERMIYRDAEGNLVIDNSSFAVAKDLQGQGLGLQVFSDEVQNAITTGVDRIETMADGNGWSTYANGYYTWARFGYIGDIPQTSLGRLAADVAAGNVPTAWGDYTTVQELMQTQAGRAWWQANGSPWQGVFDLSEGSLSRQILADYLREKGMYTQADAIASADNLAFSVAGAGGNAIPMATYDLTADDRAFVDALKAQIPDGGIKTADEAVALGQHLRERVETDLADLKGWMQEAAGIRERAPNLTDAERAWAMGDKDAIEAHGGYHWMGNNGVQARYQEAYQAQMRAYVGEVRDLGGVDLRIADSTRDLPHWTGPVEPDQLVADRLATAMQQLPSDWLQASNDIGEIVPYKSTERSSAGWHRTVGNGDSMIAIRYTKQSDIRDLEATALHELTHRMEMTIPALSDIQREYYEARTAGEEFVALTNGIREQTKLDEWLDQYLGRRPISVGRPAWQLPDGTYRYSIQSYELLTMGAEMLFASGAGADTFALWADPDYVAFVLGVFLGVFA